MKHFIYILILISFIGGYFLGYYIYGILPISEYAGWKRTKKESFFMEKRTYWNILEGDTTTYRLVVDSINHLTPEHPNYLGIAINMANKYGYAPANYDVYNCLKNVYELNNLGKMDERTERLAMEYFKRSLTYGDKRVLNELKCNLKLQEYVLRDEEKE
jgi:hypothetical protein